MGNINKALEFYRSHILSESKDNHIPIKVEKKHIPKLVKLEKDVFGYDVDIEEEYALVDAKGFDSYVIEDKGKLLGYLFLRHDKENNYMSINTLGVSPDTRGMGLGNILMDKAISEARSNKFPKIRLAVKDNNEPAIKLYEKYGFKRIGSHKYDTGEKGSVYELKL